MLSRETMEKLEGLKKTIEDIVWSFDIKKESLCRSLSGDALDVDMLIMQELMSGGVDLDASTGDIARSLRACYGYDEALSKLKVKDYGKCCLSFRQNLLGMLDDIEAVLKVNRYIDLMKERVLLSMLTENAINEAPEKRYPEHLEGLYGLAEEEIVELMLGFKPARSYDDLYTAEELLELAPELDASDQ